MLNFFNETAITPETIVIPIAIGIVIAAIMALFSKHITGKFIMCLISENAKDESSAKSLRELGFDKNLFVRLALRSGRTYNKIVKRCGEGLAEGKKNPDLLSLRYYVEEKDEERANLFYSRNGAPILIVLIAIAVFLVAIGLLLYILPNLSTMLGNIGNQISSTFEGK